MLRQLTQPPCTPISLEQARKHLAVDASDRANDGLITLLIESATADSQMKTGRIWVESDWEWVPEAMSVGSKLQFPIAPVVRVKLYDMTPPKEEEPIKPDTGEEDNGMGEDGGNSDGDSNADSEETDGATRRRLAREAAKKMREAEADTEQPNEESPDQPQESQWPEVAADYLKIEYPSLDPMGYPALGGITILQAFPEQYQLVLTVGYPVECKTELVEQFDNPTLVLSKTGFSENIIRLVFNRPVQGNVYIDNFEVRKKGQPQETEPPIEPELPEAPPEDEMVRRRRLQSLLDNELEEESPTPEGGIGNETSPDDVLVAIEDVYFLDGAIEIQYEEGAIAEGDRIQVSFFEGAAYDEFNNFVQPIILQDLPLVAFTSPDDFALPDPVPSQKIYESLAPNPIKNWILTRVGSLYSQRTEIALRAGKSNDAMFPDQFINNLLDPFRVRFLAHVR